MAKRIYVGGLPTTTIDKDLEELFAPLGTVTSVTVVTDRDTGHSKGFGFVEMQTDAQADAAILALNRTQIGGRELTVNEARPCLEHPRGSGNGDGRKHR